MNSPLWVNRFGVMAVDQGGSTGIAYGILDDTHESTLRKLELIELKESQTISGHWSTQAVTIAENFSRFRVLCGREFPQAIPAYLVMEDFILTRFASSEREGIYPAWIGGAVHGYRLGMARAYEKGGWGPAAEIGVTWQQPSEAMTFATDERLKSWGFWVRGKEHERDAFRHLAYFVHSEKARKMRAAKAKTNLR